MIISILIVIIVFILFLYLLIKSYKGIQIKQHITLFKFIRITIDLFRTIFFIPLIEIYFTVIVCDKDYFISDFKCWNTEHISYFILCLISFLLLWFLSCIFTCVSFNKKEKFSSSISKYLIINGDLILLLYKPFLVILLELCIVVDLIDITIIFIFLTSLFSSYCTYIERKYQSAKYNMHINLKYIFNIFIFVNSLMLLISNLIKELKFNGMFQFFLTISLVVLLYIYSTSINHFKLVKKPLKNERDIYNNIRIISKLIEDKSKNRYHLIKLLSYSFNLTFDEQLTKFKNKTPLKKIVEIYNNNKKENEESKLEFYFYQYLEGVYKDSLKIFRDCPLLLVNYSIFQLEKMHRYHKAYIILLKCLNLSNLNYSEEFFIYRIKRNLEEKGTELGKDQSYISYIYQINNILSLISEVSFSYSQLYGILLNNTKLMDINHLKEIAIKIDNLNNKIHVGHKIIEESGFNTKKISYFYNNFIKDILNERNTSVKYLKEDEQLYDDGIKIESYYFDINNIANNSNFKYLIASGESQDFGTILKVALELCEILGYSDKDIVGQNMNILIPNIIRIPHENLLNEKIHNTALMEEQSKINLKVIPVCLLSSSKFLIPLNLEVGIYYDENNQSIIFSKLIKSEQYYKKCVVLINNNLIIQMFSANSMYLLGLELNIINENADISYYFLEFNCELINYFSSHSVKNKDVLSIKVKLIKEYFFNNFNSIITWKNNRKFQVEWNELKIKNKLYGYIIFFEPIEINDINRSNYNESIFSPRRKGTNIPSSKTTIPFPQINKNYIPFIEEKEKINYDIKEKSYYMNDINKKNKTIKEFFQNKFERIVTNQKEKENESEKDSNNYNTESYFSSEYHSYSLDSEEEESEEEEKEEEEKEKEKSFKNIKQEIIIDTSNENDKYYEVNLMKVFLQIYDFKNHIFKDCRDYIAKSKMVKLMDEEKSITKKKITKKLTEKNVTTKFDKLNSSYVNENNNKSSELNQEKNVSNKIVEKIIRKIIKPKLINTNILYYLTFYIIKLIDLITISLILYNLLYKNIQKLFQLYESIYFECRVIGTIGLIQFYSFEYILLKNNHYYNFYQNRTIYRKSILPILMNLYSIGLNDVRSYDIEEQNLNQNYKNKFQSLKGNFTVFHQTQDLLNGKKSIQLSSDCAVKEFFFSLYYFIISEDDKIHFLNLYFNYILSNIEPLSELISNKMNIYINYLEYYISNLKKMPWNIYFIEISIIIVLTAFCLYAKINIIKEKQKYLGMFYKIDHQILKILLLKCEKYSKIQINKENPINHNNLLEIGQDDSEIDSLIEVKDNEYNYLFNNNNENFVKKKNFNQIEITKNTEFKKTIIIDFSLTIILFLIILILIFILNGSYKTYLVCSKVNQNLITEGKYIFLSLNNIRNAIVFNNIYNEPSNYNLLQQLVISISKNFTTIKEIDLDTHEISNKYKLPGNTSNILNKYLTDNYCQFLKNFTIQNNITCDEFAYNISYFGLPTIQTYYFNSLIQSGYLLLSYIQENNIKGYKFYDQYYDTSLYVDIYDDEEYANHNPFKILNNNLMRDTNVIFTIIFYPMANYLIAVIYDNLNKYNKDLRESVTLFIAFFICFIILIYLFFIFPRILRENKDINKTKIILGVIPKIVLYEIIKTEYLNDSETNK